MSKRVSFRALVASLVCLPLLVTASKAEDTTANYRDLVIKRLAAQMEKATGGKVKASEAEARIVGGGLAPSTLHKFQVGLYQAVGNGFYQIFCGGTLYKQKYVITAAHCSDFVAPGNVGVNAKSRKSHVIGEFRYVSSITIHPGWNPSTFNNDVAIWTLESPVTGVSTPPLTTQDPNVGTDLKVTGWGATFEGGHMIRNLRVVTVPQYSRSLCNSNYSGDITKKMFCAGYQNGGKDSCQGDSGGPITRKRADGKRVLQGIVSWGTGCARPNLPGVYTRISNDNIRNFIINNTP